MTDNKSKSKKKDSSNSYLKKPSVLSAVITGAIVLAWGAYMIVSKENQSAVVQTSVSSQPVVAQTNTTKQEASLTGEKIEEGYLVYLENCAVCHGQAAQGGSPGRPMGGMDENGGFIPPALNGSGHAWHHPEEVLRHIITEGSSEPTSPMKGFKDRLTEEQVDSVLEFITSLWSAEIIARRKGM